jgi:pimeloyl-ACP methyl ester carboxylesterase
VSRLLVVDIAPVSYADTLTPYAVAMRSVDVLTAVARTEVQGRLQQLVPDAAVVPFLMQNLVVHNDHFDWRINLAGISAAIEQLCGFPSDLLGARFDGPLTVLAGGNSAYVEQRDGAAFQPMFTQVQVDVIADAGHWVHADQPAAFLACARRALGAPVQLARACIPN